MKESLFAIRMLRLILLYQSADFLTEGKLIMHGFSPPLHIIQQSNTHPEREPRGSADPFGMLPVLPEPVFEGFCIRPEHRLQ